jgi:aspartyl protease family protein
MRKASGVYYVPCKINGTEMEFIFDTGASDITMSLTEALFLYKQGKLTNEDIIGKQQYQIADGSIREGAVIVLRQVQIGNCELHDVQASIIDNAAAPLLLGQSALAKFGKISIDYNRNEITFE